MTAIFYLLGFVSGAAAVLLLDLFRKAKKRSVSDSLDRDFEALLKY